MHLQQKILVVILLVTVLVANLNPVLAQSKKVDSLVRVLESHPQQDDIRANLLLELTKLTILNDTRSALKYPNEVLSFQVKIKDKNIVATAHRFKGLVYFHLGDYPEALRFLNTSLNQSRLLKNDFSIGGALGNIGLVYMYQSKFPEAVKYYLEALKVFEKINNELEYAKNLSNIGIIYTEMGNYTEALKYYQKGLPVFKKLKDYDSQSSLYANMGIVHYKNKNINEAIRYSGLALKIADSLGNMRAIARDNGNLSAYHNELKKHDLALTFGLKAISINHKTGNKKSLAINTINVSAAYLGMGNYAGAKSYGQTAMQQANELGAAEIKRDASLALSEVYQALKLPDSALFYYKQYTRLADTISNDKNKNEIMRMGIQFDFDKKELVYQQKELLTGAQLKQQQLQLALNEAELQKGLQFRDLQAAQLKNEKLQSEEKEKQLLIARNNEKLQANKVNELSQQQKLNELELKQLWLYGILALIVFLSLLVYLLNVSRIRKLKYKNEIQQQQATQNELKLKHQYQLSESELKAIRSQMNPHFIFNVLNSIEAYVMDNEKRKASRLIQKFAALSRLILENSTKSLVTGDKEWKALMLYTELEAMRYDDAFSFSFTVDEAIHLQTLLLPPMLIQPLIENAILHGLIIDPKADAHLSVALEKIEDGICITVEDNGVGIGNITKKNNKGGVKEMSMGLASIRERIEMINKQYIEGRSSFTLKAGIGEKGTIAVLSLPLFEPSDLALK